MGYTKQGFYSGGKLKASQLEAMEDGIIEAQQLSHNMESGSGDFAVQQVPEVGAENGFDFTGRNAHAIELDPSLAAVLPYGATGNYSSAFGSKNASMAKRAMAIGNKTVAKGEESLAAGYQSVTLSSGCFAHGTETVAGRGKVDGVEKGASAHSEGYHTVAIGDGSHAEGIDTLAEGDYSHSEGSQTKAIGYASHAEGDRCEAIGVCSHAGGAVTIAGYDYQTIVGMYNLNKDDTLFEVGNGADTDKRSNAFEVYNNGLVAVGNKVQQLPRTDKVTQKEGEVALHFDFTGIEGNGLGTRIQYGAIGNYSVSLNGRSAALNKHATSIGNSTIAKGEESFAQGYETIAEGNSSFSGGSRTWAKAEAATALGAQTIAEGKASIALGSQSIAHGEASLAQGWGAKAYGNYSTVIGQETQTGWGKEQGYTGGLCSFAGGYNCKAFGDYSFVFGHSSAALATNSFAFGYRTQATANNQFVLGRCNKDGGNNALFIIGCGTDDKRDNAFEVYSDGDIGIKKGDKIYSLHKMLAAYFTDANLKHN